MELLLNQHSQARHSEARLEPREDLASVNQPQEQVLLEVQRHQQLDLVLVSVILRLLLFIIFFYFFGRNYKFLLPFRRDRVYFISYSLSQMLSNVL